MGDRQLGLGGMSTPAMCDGGAACRWSMAGDWLVRARKKTRERREKNWGKRKKKPILK